MFLLILLSLCSVASSSLINRVGNTCDPPPVPQFFHDSALGSHCRFNASYSQLDIGFIIELTEDISQDDITNLKTLLTTEFNLFYGKYGNDTNDVSVIAASQIPTVTVQFGGITSWEDLASEFNNFPQWYQDFQHGSSNINAALEKMDSLFDYDNNRGKLVVILVDISKIGNLASIVNTMKDDKNVKIFVVGLAKKDSDLQASNSYLQNLCTPGWYMIVRRDNTREPNSISVLQTYSNFARQASCKCLPDTTQFFAKIPSSNPSIGPVVYEYYADCLENHKQGDYVLLYKDAIWDCPGYTDDLRQSLLLNSSQKFEFTKEHLAKRYNENNLTFWTALANTEWVTYGVYRVPVSYLPDDNNAAREICESKLNIPPGDQGVLTAYQGSFIFCRANRDLMLHTYCESKAVDSFDNPKLCPGPYINADTRPIQVATPCSEVLEYLYSDILVVADVSKVISVQQMNSLSQSLLKTFERLNFDRSQRHSSRISLITFATLAKVEFGFNKISNATDLANLLNLSKYRNIFDGQRNANLAFLLAKTTLFSNLSYRKPTIVFISSGFSNSQDPSQIVSLIKTLYNANVITISTTPDNNNVDKLASEGLDLDLGPELPDTFKFALTQSSCYCPANSIQFVHKDPMNQAVTRYAECFFGNPIPKTPDDAFAYCSKFNSTPVVITSQAKAQFLIESVIPNEISQSPMFSLGLKRHMSYNSMFMWHEYLQDGYTYATYPPKLSSFHDLNQNCTAAVVTGEKDVGIVAMNCKDFKLPVICQKKAIDANS